MAFPGFAYGGELFDAITSEYVFEVNAKAVARDNNGATGARSVSEVTAFERLNSICVAANVALPSCVAGGLAPLPPNTGERFGLEDLGE